jgi:tetratricopeptide (TPR) repeat protein
MALGNLYFSLGRFNPALKAHQKALALNPDSAAAHASVGETLLFLRRHGEAIVELDRAIALDAIGSAGQFANALKEAHGLGIFG